MADLTELRDEQLLRMMQAGDENALPRCIGVVKETFTALCSR